MDLYQRGKQFWDLSYLKLTWNVYMLKCVKHVDVTCLQNISFQNYWNLDSKIKWSVILESIKAMLKF